eukprot:jgi/Bigna1/83362/fgenesh1_pg.107_\
MQMWWRRGGGGGEVVQWCQAQGVHRNQSAIDYISERLARPIYTRLNRTAEEDGSQELKIGATTVADSAKLLVRRQYQSEQQEQQQRLASSDELETFGMPPEDASRARLRSGFFKNIIDDNSNDE